MNNADYLALTAQQAAIGLITAAVEGPDSATFTGSTFEQVHHAMILGYLDETRAPLLASFEALIAAISGYTAGALVHSEGSRDNAIDFLRATAIELQVHGFDEPPC